MTPELRRISPPGSSGGTRRSRSSPRLDDLLCRVMALGDLADANYIETVYGPHRLRTALTSAPPGVLDIRSWHYWHHRLGLGEAGPLPSRRFE